MHNGIARNGRLNRRRIFPDMTTFHAYKVHDGVTEMIDPPDAVVSDARDVSPSARSLDFSSICDKTHGFLLRKGGVHYN